MPRGIKSRGEVAPAHSELIQELIREAIQKGECDLEMEAFTQAELEKVMETIRSYATLSPSSSRLQNPQPHWG